MSFTILSTGPENAAWDVYEGKLSRLPEVKAVNVQAVFDPPWHVGLMSEAAKLQLGFDLDYGTPAARMSG